MDFAVVEQSTGRVISRVTVDQTEYEPGEDFIAVQVDPTDVAYAGCTWSEAGGFVEPPAEPIDPVKVKAMLTAYAADKRWRVETSGISVSGVPVATDDRSKIMIIGARVKADNDPNFTTEWKTPEGFTTINAATIIAISDAVLAHVDACFAVEAVVLAGIEGDTITTVAGIDAANWP